MHVCVCVCVCVCMYVCMYVRSYVRTNVGRYVCMYICTYVRTYVCMYVRMYVHTYVRTYVLTYVCMYVCMDGWMDVCVCVCVCVYVCMYVCSYTLHLSASRGYLLVSEYVAICISSLFYSISLGLQLEQASFLQTFSTLVQRNPGRHVNENLLHLLIWYVRTVSVVYHLKDGKLTSVHN